MLAALLVSGGLSACGKHVRPDARVKVAETEGIYLDVSELKYQVQVSRQLNPADVQDKPYLVGDPRGRARAQARRGLVRGRACACRTRPTSRCSRRRTSRSRTRRTRSSSRSSSGRRTSSPTAPTYAIPPRETYPLLDSPGYDTPSRGALLLFKLTLTALNNRPLELKIEGRKAPQQTGIVDLDV